MKPHIILIVALASALPASSEPAATADTPKPATFARFVPERMDDFAWENDLIAFRAYGPALRDGAENSGIDCWLKRVPYPIVNKWYAEDKQGKSYHKDHGEGLDSYKVGASAGCGGTAILINGKHERLETFTTHEVIAVTPQQSTFKLSYQREIDGTVYGEQKTITITLGKRLFQVESLFLKDGKPAPGLTVSVGLTTHDGNATPFSDKDKGWIATWETLDDSELGTGARIKPADLASITTVESDVHDESHIYLITRTDDAGKIRYEAGYGWKKAGAIQSRDDWADALSR